MNDPPRILAFAGSLRRASYNRGLVRAALEEAPPGMTVVAHDLSEIPLYNHDVEVAGVPEPVAAFKRAIAEADALLIATPEYNYAIPGVLKNALDWASRGEPRVFKHKPVALIGASPGPWGTIRSQTMTRTILYGMAMLVLPPPEHFIPRAAEKFDAEGNLTDPAVRKIVRELLDRLMAWARQHA